MLPAAAASNAFVQALPAGSVSLWEQESGLPASVHAYQGLLRGGSGTSASASSGAAAQSARPLTSQSGLHPLHPQFSSLRGDGSSSSSSSSSFSSSLTSVALLASVAGGIALGWSKSTGPKASRRASRRRSSRVLCKTLAGQDRHSAASTTASSSSEDAISPTAEAAAAATATATATAATSNPAPAPAVTSPPVPATTTSSSSSSSSPVPVPLPLPLPIASLNPSARPPSPMRSPTSTSSPAFPLPSGGLLALCGPSGVGKSTLIRRLLDDPKWKDTLTYVVSHTTRAPRDGEVDGVHYHFVKRSEMESLIQVGAFLEHTEVNGELYGTSIASLEEASRGGKLCLLDVNLAGVQALQKMVRDLDERQSILRTNVRFCRVLAQGGLEELQRRLESRGSENKASLQRRLEEARRELQQYESVTWDLTVSRKDGSDEDFQDLLALLESMATSSRAAALEEEEVAEKAAAASVPKNVFAEFSGIARALGDKCVDLGQGFPNFDPPEFVIQALRDELEEEEGGAKSQIRHQYTRTAGHPPLVEVLAERYSRHFDRALDPLAEVAVTVGATGGLFLALQAALAKAQQRTPPGEEPPREIVALEPFFELYRAQANGLNAKLRSVPLDFDEDSRSFRLNIEALRNALGPQTAALIVNTPHNPTGKAFERWELEAIAELVQEHPDILVISDEVYKYMVFEPPDGSSVDLGDLPTGHVHMATLPGMWDKTVTVSSAGKTFGITGWQIGWIVGPPSWMESIHRFMPNLQFCAPTLMQRALSSVLERATEPFEDSVSYYAWLRKDFARRRQVMIDAFEGTGIKPVRSQGGFFLLADVADVCGPEVWGEVWEKYARLNEPPDWTFCRVMADELGIVALPVSPFFGPEASDRVRTRFVRFCFAKLDETLLEARRRLQILKSKVNSTPVALTA